LTRPGIHENPVVSGDIRPVWRYSWRYAGSRKVDIAKTDTAMPTIVKPLTDTAIRSAKPGAKVGKLRDGGGLYLLVTTDGSRLWRFDYRRPVTGKRNTLGVGTYPEVGLAAARARRDDVRRQLAAGIDPGEQRKAVKAAGVEPLEPKATCEPPQHARREGSPINRQRTSRTLWAYVICRCTVNYPLLFAAEPVATKGRPMSAEQYSRSVTANATTPRTGRSRSSQRNCLCRYVPQRAIRTVEASPNDRRAWPISSVAHVET